MDIIKNALNSEPAAADAETGVVGKSVEGLASSGALPDPMSILDQARDAIVILGLDGAVRYWNGAAERIFEWRGPEVMQRHAQDFLWAAPQSADEALAGVLAGGVWNGELAIVKKSGGVALMESRWSLLRDERTRSRSILTIHSDITEKRKREDQAARAQQAEGLTAFARGIAHDFNNVLGPIIMAADLFRLTMKSQRELELLETVETSARLGSEIVRQMLSLSKDCILESNAGAESQAGGTGDEFPRGRGELILVMDDEISIRVIASRTLEAHGYRVIAACDGADGVKRYSERRHEVALVIIDMVMPVMEGGEAIRALKKLDHSVNIIASSGVNMNAAEEEALQNGANLFLRKPYTVPKLLAVVKEALRPRKSV